MSTPARESGNSSWLSGPEEKFGTFVEATKEEPMLLQGKLFTFPIGPTIILTFPSLSTTLQGSPGPFKSVELFGDPKNQSTKAYYHCARQNLPMHGSKVSPTTSHATSRVTL